MLVDRLRDLWMKINTRNVIFFDPMLEKELEKALPTLLSGGVFAYSVLTSQREIVGTEEGKMAYVQDTGVSYQTTGNRMPYNEFLKRINRATSVPTRRSIHSILRNTLTIFFHSICHNNDKRFKKEEKLR